ncbi:MAG: ABC transporter ATP-binding protein [Clostridia bacterium]|nr:ABC transporter ATP-binding protein [Clostridia bacterium]
MNNTNEICALKLAHVTKTFGHIIANKDVDLELRYGEVLAILGENGSGKTTLMNMISGIYHPDEGEIYINGEAVTINSPRDAFDHGIGMVHQHFKLVDVFTATENIVLGISDKDGFNIKKSAEKIKAICDKYGFELDPNKKIYEMSVSEKQTVEIVKVLYRGAEILILDEPTAVLTPQETDKLFNVIRRMREDEKSIIIITHKLHEVMAISDRVAVLRKGMHIATVNTAEVTESELTDMMVGQKVSLNIERTQSEETPDRLTVSHLTLINKDGLNVINDISFSAKAGEILGIAGVAGSGQRELLETIAGLRVATAGEITYFDPKTGAKTDLRKKTPVQIRDLGVRLSFVPEDRLGMGLVGNLDIADNMLIRTYTEGSGMFVNMKKPRKLAEEIVKEFDVVTPDLQTPVRKLSGGNVQKVLVGREIAGSPSLLMSAYAVRGLDINTSYTIYNLMNEQKRRGAAVIYVGEDLDVLLELCDRIMVLCAGSVSGIVDGRAATKEEVGLMMTHIGGNADKEAGRK